MTYLFISAENGTGSAKDSGHEDRNNNINKINSRELQGKAVTNVGNTGTQLEMKMINMPKYKATKDERSKLVLQY